MIPKSDMGKEALVQQIEKKGDQQPSHEQDQEPKFTEISDQLPNIEDSDGEEILKNSKKTVNAIGVKQPRYLNQVSRKSIIDSKAKADDDKSALLGS